MTWNAGLKGKWKWGLTALVGIVVLLVWWSWPAEEPFLAEVSIPGSTDRIRLLRLESGPLRYQKTTPWASPAMRPLRRIFRVSAPYRNININFAGPSPVALFSMVDERGLYPLNVQSGGASIEFLDSQGFIHCNHPHGLTTGSIQVNGQQNVTGIVIDSIPRREPQLRLRICSLFGFKNTSQPLEMTIPNPLYRSQFTEWTPQPLGTSVTQGDLSVSLLGVSITPDLRTVNSIPMRSLTARFETVFHDPQWQDAEIEYLFEDVTGNRAMWLSPFEPAWKVIASVYRHSEAPHPASMVTDLGKFRVPPPGQIQILNQTVSLEGFQMKLICVCGGGTVTRVNDKITVKPPENTGQGFSSGSSRSGQNREYHITCSQPYLVYESGNVPEGRRIEQPVRFHRSHQDNGGVELPPNLSEGEHTLELVDSHPERFEFIVAPPDVLKKQMIDLQNQPPVPSPQRGNMRR